MKENMFYGAGPLIFQKASELRNQMTPAEEVLWNNIHINQWKLKFRRQHPISNYIADFYCHNIKLVIELDGSIHDLEETKIIDKQREQDLIGLGLTVLRFKNEEIFKNLSSVLTTISTTISKLQSSPLGDGGNLTVIKIGGNIIDNENALAAFLAMFASVPGKKILVHGGGKLATQLAGRLGVEQQMADGRRITDAETLKIVTMVYAGYINKNIVAQLQSHGCNAIGLSGADGNLIQAHKRRNANIDYGFVGDVDTVNVPLLRTLLDTGNTIVAAPITHDSNGQLLNTNADTIAQEIATSLAGTCSVQLIYSFEKAGVLLDVNDETSLIREITPAYYEELKTGQKIFAGMIPKLDNAFAAVKAGVKKVIIGKAENIDALINGTTGTAITQ